MTGMTEEQQKIIFDMVKRLAFEDAKVIDATAKTLDIGQKYIYRLFIEYHEMMFYRLYEEEKE